MRAKLELQGNPGFKRPQRPEAEKVLREHPVCYCVLRKQSASSSCRMLIFRLPKRASFSCNHLSPLLFLLPVMVFSINSHVSRNVGSSIVLISTSVK